MPINNYGTRLGMLSDEQFQAALDRFELGRLLRTEPIHFGNFGQNAFVSSTQGEYVLRGCPHYSGQFPTEQFYARMLHKHTQAPVPWPYLYDPSSDIFGWSYVLMPRMQGLQLADPEIRNNLSIEDRKEIARALGENLALTHEFTWPFCGRYDPDSSSILPLEPDPEAGYWPFSTKVQSTTDVAYPEVVLAKIHYHLNEALTINDRTTPADVAWAEDIITHTQDALYVPFQPCYIMEDYKRDNLVVMQSDGTWRVSGVFDVLQGHFGDGEVDLPRSTAMYSYMEENPPLAQEFVHAYLSKRPPRPGFAERFQIYMLLDRSVIWEFLQRTNQIFWDNNWTFRDWAERYLQSLPL